jgi:hypothetical protein
MKYLFIVRIFFVSVYVIFKYDFRAFLNLTTHQIFYQTELILIVRLCVTLKVDLYFVAIPIKKGLAFCVCV